MANLKVRVHGLLIDLIKREFPKLRVEISKELRDLNANRDKMGPPRSDEHSQRAYLGKMSEAFQNLVRGALAASYTSEKLFSRRHDLRLVTRVVDMSERFNKCIQREGHRWRFGTDEDISRAGSSVIMGKFLDLRETMNLLRDIKSPDTNSSAKQLAYPELDEFNLDFEAFTKETPTEKKCIMEYIEEVYNGSRGQDLGTVS